MSAPSKLMKARNILLIRHGEYDFNTGKLTDRGCKKQASHAAYRLKQMNISVGPVYHSTLTRATETASIIHKNLRLPFPLIADSMLEEGGPTPPNPTISYWSLPERDYHVDGPRLESAFRRYFFRPDDNDGQTNKITNEVIIAHGNIIRFFVLRSLQLPTNTWMRMFVAHASITRLHIQHDGIVSMSLFGDSGHIDYKDLTY
ncbi:hypothetical protein HELRODRAFT_70034 [Helobdella robusta]|uniref:Serine/threonine-protein phosphatase PGAM5, mitochondrial n=1 Tax=Helobdella robusta TaxID=6412 RepID=T1G017_HELRO|nr:hypothetical protein HELRODRAFT_70034 [Helobdella robusta]ESN91738.1 hypothetical protein HELRODRAFT_70034 [Helobdella robusta]